jgi:hypothetical protein
MEEVLLFEDPIQVGSDARAHDVLMAIYRNPKMPFHTRMRAAGLALPFESPKLIATAVIDGRDFASRLERAVKRSRSVAIEAKVIDATAIPKPEDPPKPKTSVKPRLLPVPDRRFRRI